MRALAVMVGIGVLAVLARSLLQRERRPVAAGVEGTPDSAEGFAYAVAHDLRAPLRLVDGWSSILVETHGAQLDEEARRTVEVIRDSAKKASRLLDDLLDWSRVGRATMQPRMLDMTGLAVAALRAACAAEPGRDIRIDVGALPEAYADDALIRRVWALLASNAVKFTRPRAVAHIRVEGRREGEEAVFSVRDDGVGFDVRYGDKLFGVFQRLHGEEEFEGTGMGLALVRSIVERHGGRVGADSLPEGGAAFWFSLPAGPTR